jgi:predicted porin
VAATVNNLLGANIYIGFGKAEDDTSNNDLTSWTLAVSHNFSKQTSIYVGHSQFDCDTGGAGASLSICSSVSASGGEDDKTSFGIKHKF